MKLVTLFVYLSGICLRIDGFGLFSTTGKGVNGGIPCAACTFTVGLVEQLAQVHNETITQTVDNLCNLVPAGAYRDACIHIIDRYGPLVIDLLYAKATPDIVCHSIKFCHVDVSKSLCHLFPLPKHHGEEETLKRIRWGRLATEHYFKKRGMKDVEEFPDICSIPGIKFICDLIDKVIHQHRPILDLDKDGYSTLETLRGTAWRGRDCNEADSLVHPGTRPKDSDVEFDSNCNGIYGVDSDGVPYEDKLCADVESLGIGILGDSAGAHFHIPPEWLTASTLNKDILSHLPYVVENEFDWPMMSSVTGYVNITWPIIHGPVQSTYTMMKDRNRCIHRDYQNLAVNGAKCTNIQSYQLELSRNQTRDNPMLMFYALVGNDVCNGHPDTVAHMTTVEQMREYSMKTFKFLDTKLPAGSHVVVIGLADGRVLYNNMFWRYHPFGKVNKDVKYPDFYEFMKCLEISPCNGWMTANSTLRDLTFDRAMALNKALKSVVDENKDKFENFDMVYLDCPLMPVINHWEKQHGPRTGYQLIEQVDGFHPNQYALELSAIYTWEYLAWNSPHFLGDQNPHNEEIHNIFGDQGGY